MRYRLMAIYRGVPYEAGIGPTDREVVLFAACPPPEDLGFQPAPGHWRKAVTRAEVDDVWEARPAGTFGGEPCIIIDDLGDELHIGYAGTDPARAGRLGYCQVEPGVFEVLAPRDEVTEITEERVHHALPRLQPPDPATWEGLPARVTRPATRAMFAELAGLAALPDGAYAVDEEVDGAVCLVGTEAGYEVFICQDGARHELRVFGDEETAYFYLFGLLAAEAVRDGRLVPGSLITREEPPRYAQV